MPASVALQKHSQLKDLELRYERLRSLLFPRGGQREGEVQGTHSSPQADSVGGWDNWSDWSQFNQFSNY